MSTPLADESGPELAEDASFRHILRAFLRRHVWYSLVRLRRRFVPYLVWHGDEVDVGVHFKGLGALGGDPGVVFVAEKAIRSMGISFDAGSGCDGRDWEWDWSLRGPLSVTFRARARNPERRIPERCPALRLVS